MSNTVGRPNFTPCPYRTLAFFVYRFDRLASTVPYRFPLKTAKPRTEPFKTEFYTHILLKPVFHNHSFSVNRYNEASLNRTVSQNQTVFRFLHRNNGKRYIFAFLTVRFAEKFLELKTVRF